jgi:VanZ family protein
LPFFVIPIALSAAVALVDEFIVQASTEGRGPSFFDVLIDTSGAAVGAALIFGLLFALNRVRNRKADGR